MKNWKKITLITGTVCTILGFFLLIFGLFAGGIQYLTSTDLGSFNNSDKNAAKVQKLVTEELSPYKNLDVSLDSLNLQVRYSKDNTYALSYKNTKTCITEPTPSQPGNISTCLSTICILLYCKAFWLHCQRIVPQ